jgi:hypothetical protein
LLLAVPPGELAEDGLSVFAACAVVGSCRGGVVMGAAAVEKAEELEENERM